MQKRGSVLVIVLVSLLVLAVVSTGGYYVYNKIVKEPTTSSTISCIESDGGVDFENLGQNCLLDSCMNDFCVDDKTLNEYYCGKNGGIFSEIYTCEGQCLYGVCTDLSALPFTYPDECIVNWQCSEWSQCDSFGLRYRNCMDLSRCNNDGDMPIESELCIINESRDNENIGNTSYPVNFKPDFSCEHKNYFNVAFILLGNNNSEFTSERIERMNHIGQILPGDFYDATDNKAYFNTSYSVTLIQITPEMKIENPDIPYSVSEVTKVFYLSNPDDFDFIVVITPFQLIRNGQEYVPQYFTRTQTNLYGIGKKMNVFDNALSFGSNGTLKGVVFIPDVDRFFDESRENKPKYISNLLIHEIAHYWCCYVGDVFSGISGNSNLDILEPENNGIHFYPGLHLPYLMKQGIMGSVNWIPNPSRGGTFISSTLNSILTSTSPTETAENMSRSIGKLHPFALYLMGVLPESEYGKKYPFYNAGLAEEGTLTLEYATPYKNVSINDIIAVEGERRCIS